MLALASGQSLISLNNQLHSRSPAQSRPNGINRVLLAYNLMSPPGSSDSLFLYRLHHPRQAHGLLHGACDLRSIIIRFRGVDPYIPPPESLFRQEQRVSQPPQPFNEYKKAV